MNKREEARLNELLAKKQAEEKAEKAFFTKVKRQRVEVLKVLGVSENNPYEAALEKIAAKYGTTKEGLLEYINTDRQINYYKNYHNKTN